MSAPEKSIKTVCLELEDLTYARLSDLAASTGLTISRTALDLIKQQLQSQSNTQNSKASKAAFEPNYQLREAAISPPSSALLLIDIQNFNCHPNGALYSDDPYTLENQHWWQRMEVCKPLWHNLITRCREAGIEVIHTVIQSLTSDGRDRSMDYKISGFHVPPGSFDGQSLDCVRPLPDEILIPKTSASVFTTTNIDRILRNLEKTSVIVAGCLTDQCVESAVRDACDLNYRVTLVTDACATYTQERHVSSLRAIKGYCRQRTCKELLLEIEHSIQDNKIDKEFNRQM